MLDFFIIGANYGTLVGSTLLSISSSNPIHSILSLITTFFAGSFFIVILKLVFFALIFLAVYLGAIAVLFLFIVMMLDIKTINDSQRLYKTWFFKDLLIILLPFIWLDVEQKNINILFLIKNFIKALPQNENPIFSFDVEFFNYYQLVQINTQLTEIGRYMFDQTMFAFIFSGLILFIAMIGAIVLTVESKQNKILFQQDVVMQMSRHVNISLYSTKKIFENTKKYYPFF